MAKEAVSFFWFRRDLRLEDNLGLFQALQSKYPVIPVFIFDETILERLPNNDPRVGFIHESLAAINGKLNEFGASLLVKKGKPSEVWESLLNDYNISPFNDDIRGLKAYCYPEYNSDKFFELIDNKQYSDEIDYTKRILLHSLLNSPDKTWLFNTEEMCIMKEKTDITYDVVALPCAGFKFLDLLHSDLIHEKSNIVFFDFSESSVEWINYVINSEELTITDLVLNKPEEVKLIGKTIEKLSVDGIPSNDLIRLSEEVYSFYGGINNFMRLLKKFRTFNIEIINTDIINDPLNCLHRLNGDNNLINISNIFSTDYFNLFYSEKERTDKFERFIKTLNRSTTVVGRGVDTYYSEKSYNNG